MGDIMDYEKMIKTLIERVGKLERKVEKLEKSKTTSSTSKSYDKNHSMTRNEAALYIMDQLTKYNPEYTAVKGNRTEGSGIILSHEQSGTVYKSKYFHANNLRRDRLFGWHKVHKRHVEDAYDFYIFTIKWNQKIHSFIFNLEDMSRLVSEKEVNDKGYYLLYFEQRGVQYFENRDKSDQFGNDVTANHSNWRVLKPFSSAQIITDQEIVYDKVLDVKLTPQDNEIVSVDFDAYPKEREETILVEDTYPTNNWNLEDDWVQNKKVFIDIHCIDNDLSYILNVVNEISSKFHDNQEINYIARYVPNSSFKVNTFIILNEPDNNQYIWSSDFNIEED